MLDDPRRHNCASDAHFLAPTGSFAPTFKKSLDFARSQRVFRSNLARPTSFFRPNWPSGRAPGRPGPRFSRPTDQFFEAFFDRLFHRAVERFFDQFPDDFSTLCRSMWRSIFVRSAHRFSIARKRTNLKKPSETLAMRTKIDVRQ